jgi:hypothetical protein
MGNKGKRRINFEHYDAPGRRIFIAGSFNEWTIGCKDWELKATNDDLDLYALTKYLSKGQYGYKFVAVGEGTEEWMIDEHNARFEGNGLGGINSLLVVE